MSSTKYGIVRNKSWYDLEQKIIVVDIQSKYPNDKSVYIFVCVILCSCKNYMYLLYYIGGRVFS